MVSKPNISNCFGFKYYESVLLRLINIVELISYELKLLRPLDLSNLRSINIVESTSLRA